MGCEFQWASWGQMTGIFLSQCGVAGESSSGQVAHSAHTEEGRQVSHELGGTLPSSLSQLGYPESFQRLVWPSVNA